MSGEKREEEEEGGDGGAPLASSAAEVGVIEPPPELREVVHRTAEFVARQGRQVEAMILQRNARSKKFQFLNPQNPYHAYYQLRVAGGGGGAAGKEAAAAAREAAEKEKKAAREKEAEKAAAKERKPKTIEERIDEMYSTSLVAAEQVGLDEALAEAKRRAAAAAAAEDDEEWGPEGHTVKVSAAWPAADVETVRITAEYVAKRGRSFLAELSRREQKNSRYGFLRATHPLFTLFQQLVAVYARVLAPPAGEVARLRADAADPFRVLGRIRDRAARETVAAAAEEERRRAEAEDAKAAVAVDWSRFVVVAAIDFDDDELDHLPQPCDNIDDINAMLHAQMVAEQNRGEAGAGGTGLEADGAAEMDVDAGVETAEDLVRRLQDEARAREERRRNARYQRCPVCGQDVAVEELEEHMRIELLDPRWKEQRQAMEEKLSETNQARAVDIGANLARMARKRDDVFIDTATAEQRRRDAEEEAARRERAANVWDGHNSSARVARASALAAARPPAPAAAPAAAAAPPPPPPPPPPPQAARPAPPPEAEPPAKRARLDDDDNDGGEQLQPGVQKMPEAAFAALHGGEATLSVRVPSDASHSEWHFEGQTLEVRLAGGVAETVGAVKARVAEALGMPAAKQKLRVATTGVFINKDAFSLARYNVPSGTALELGVKERGRRRK